MANNDLEARSMEQEAGENKLGVRSSELGVRGKKINHWLWWVLGVAIVAAIASGAYYYWTKNKTTTTPTTTTTTTDGTSSGASAKLDSTADWKTYTNTDYGFSFKYPKDWYALENNSLYKQMCIKETQTQSARNDSSFCNNLEAIVTLNNLNAYCNKGGCTDVNLNSLNGKVETNNSPYIRLQSLSINKLTSVQRSDWELFYKKLHEVKITPISISGIVLTKYDVPKVEKEMQLPNQAIFWSNKGQDFSFTMAIETKTEDQEKIIFDQILSTFTFTK